MNEQKFIDIFVPPDRPGTKYKNGKMYLFGKKNITVIRPWPPAAYMKSVDNPAWKHIPLCNLYPISGELLMKESEINNEHKRKCFEFYSQIPEKVRQAMSLFPNPWRICALCAYVPEGIELAYSSPALSFMLANYRIFRPKLTKFWQPVRRIIKKPRKIIAKWLGWPGTESMVKILSKIEPEACYYVLLLKLRKALRNEPELIKLLSHLPKISSDILRIISHKKEREYAGWGLILQLSKMDNVSRKGAVRIFYDTQRMEIDLGLKLKPLNNIETMNRRHEHAIKIINDKALHEISKRPPIILPPPPVPVPEPTENLEIIPIDTEKKLLTEAIEQRNCVYSHRDIIANGSGKIYIYSMRKPERATIMICEDKETFFLQEIKASLNRPVMHETEELVKQWLKKQKPTYIPYEKNDLFAKKLLEYPDSNKLFPQCPLIMPQPHSDFSIEQIRSPSCLAELIEAFECRFTSLDVERLYKGDLWVFLIEGNDCALLVVPRIAALHNWYMNPLRGYANNRYSLETENLIAEWLEEAYLRYIASEHPDQLLFDFAKTPEQTAQ